MRYDDSYDEPPSPSRARGVSPAWRVVAVLSFLGVLSLLAVVAALTVALVVQEERQANANVPDAQPWPRPPLNEDDMAGGADLPYPTKQDLRPPDSLPALDGETPRPKEDAPRDAFRKASEVVWTAPALPLPERVLVSPDGARIAYLQGDTLWAGPPDGINSIGEPGHAPNAGPRGRRRWMNGLPTPLAWSPDGSSLYSTDADGALRADNLQGGVPPRPPDAAHARGLAYLPEGGQAVVVRPRGRTKVEGPEGFVRPDPTEVVVVGPNADAHRVLVPVGRATWRDPAVSPDGKLLALVSDSGHEGEFSATWRLFVVPVAGGEPKPLTPAALHVGSPCWAPDGKAIVYERRARRALEEDVLPGEGMQANLYEVDPTTGRDTRLTWGGGFSSPTVTRDGNLYCFFRSAGSEGFKGELLRLPLAKARELASRPDLKRRTVRVWVDLASAVLKEASLPADLTPLQLDEGKVRKIQEAFVRQYRERVGGAVLDTAAALDDVRSNLRGLDLPAAERRRFNIVLGAVAGEYLCRRHKARWDFAARADGPPLADPEAHAAFRWAANPFGDIAFDDPDRDDEDAFTPVGPLRSLLSAADGRPIVLTPRPGAVRQHVPAADADLARGVGLLKDGKGAEAERVLTGMLARHAGNLHLTLHVATLLHDHGRADAFRELARKLDVDKLKDSRAYNLVGVSLLKEDATAAAGAFKNALRCDLHFGPAYFNLAEAYALRKDAEAARLCLRRYLDLMPFHPSAEDARRRLDELSGQP